MFDDRDHTQVEVGRDVVLECKVNNLGPYIVSYEVVDIQNDHGDDGWLVVMLLILILRMMMLLTIITACTTGKLAHGRGPHHTDLQQTGDNVKPQVL